MSDRKEYKRNWYLKNKERIIEETRKKRQEDLVYRLGRAPGRRAIPIKLRRKIVERAGSQCEMKDSRPCKGHLSLHHVDGDSDNNEESNLKLTCDFHHKSHEGKLRYPKGSPVAQRWHPPVQ